MKVKLTLHKGTEYNIKDIEILDSKQNNSFCIIIPSETCVVIGASNNYKDAVYAEKIEQDKINVYKRLSGGQTVLLSPETLVIGVKIINTDRSHFFFKIINSKIIKTLESLGVENLYSKGISDISIHNKKILGSSMFKKKDTLYYHAVLNIKEDPELISRYIKHPTKEPDYREGRHHSEFITSLELEGYSIDIESIKRSLHNAFKNLLKNI